MPEPVGGSTRLDIALATRGLAPTRSRARDLIRRGFVIVDGEVVVKPSQPVVPDSTIALRAETPQFVSRAGEKLVAALDHFAFRVEGCVALDIGASTGGFSEVLLKRGARRVFAVDVGRDQLDSRLRQDPRLTNLEATDARDLSKTALGDTVDGIVIDVSFISLRLVLPTVLALSGAQCWLVALIKPQCEVGPDFVGKDGVVRDAAAAAGAVADVRAWLAELEHWSVRDVITSPLRGVAGNQEFLIGAERNE